MTVPAPRPKPAAQRAVARRALLRGALVASLATPAIGCAPGELRLRSGERVPRGEIPLYLVSRDWHTDVLCDADLLDATTRALLMPSLPQGGHAAIGFGARDFMMEPEPTVGHYLVALLNSPGAVAVSRMPPRLAEAGPFEDVAEIRIDRVGFGRLLHHIRAEIAEDEAGLPRRLGASLFRSGRVLFEAKRSYSSLFTCNSWVAEMLSAAGLPFETEGVIWPTQVMRQAHRLAALQGVG